MTHDELIRCASSWLVYRKRCSIVASELVSGSAEIPDVIGWHGWSSTLIEAKISVADFRMDQRKMFRKYKNDGMGMFRYYIIPFELKEVITPLLPEGWGLLLAKPHRTGLTMAKVEKGSVQFDCNKNNEALLLSSIIRRIAGNGKPLQGVAVKCYAIGIPDPKAELFIEPEPA